MIKGVIKPEQEDEFVSLGRMFTKKGEMYRDKLRHAKAARKEVARSFARKKYLFANKSMLLPMPANNSMLLPAHL